MTYTRSQNYINMVVGEHETQTFKVVTFVLLLDIFVPTNAHPFFFEQVVCPNVLKYELNHLVTNL